MLQGNFFPQKTYRVKLNMGPSYSRQLQHASQCRQAARFHAVLTVARTIKPKESEFHGRTFVCMPRSVVRVFADRALHASTISYAISPVACHHNGDWHAFLMTGVLFVAAATVKTNSHPPSRSHAVPMPRPCRAHAVPLPSCAAKCLVWVVI
jgi:hypothetical protein